MKSSSASHADWTAACQSCPNWRSSSASWFRSFRMRFRDALLAALTSVIWGLAFVATKLGLEGFSAPERPPLRFLLAGLPVFWVPPPRLAWPRLILVGMTLFCGQF